MVHGFPFVASQMEDLCHAHNQQWNQKVTPERCQHDYGSSNVRARDDITEADCSFSDDNDPHRLEVAVVVYLTDCAEILNIENAHHICEYECWHDQSVYDCGARTHDDEAFESKPDIGSEAIRLTQSLGIDVCKHGVVKDGSDQ